MIREYFLDPPDPARLEAAEDRLAAAEDRLEWALRDLDAFAPKPPPPAPAPLPEVRPHPGYALAAAAVLAFGVCLVLIDPWFTIIALPCLVGSIALVNAGVAHRADDRAARERAIAEARRKKAARKEADARREAHLHSEVDRLTDALDDARDIYDEELRAYEDECRRRGPKPSDALMDRTLLDDIHSVKEHALVRLRLHRSELVRPAYMREMTPAELENAPANTPDAHDPFVVYGPAYGADYPVWCVLGEGPHAKRRYSRYKVMIICTTRYHVALYRCVLDFFTGELDEESTAEYHYADVVAVHSETDPNSTRKINIRTPRQSQRHLRDAPQAERYFELVVSSGDRARIVTGLTRRRTGDDNPEHFHVLGNDPNFDAGADSIRMMLREKKSGTDPR
ncbi:hypothetical protein [Streptomyces sp. NBC_00083]|uniref:hypothetical protein n=1 Tax=Streptomyces sp. NBC_00083 TaxID=2975647 RepID=UPI00225AE8AC|nr:hypothetical protein [Streptomyces sp. NBC_00083]MCX5387657.1 hypothetical protein [Streptomyces sp. NBC_00083]